MVGAAIVNKPKVELIGFEFLGDFFSFGIKMR